MLELEYVFKDLRKSSVFISEVLDKVGYNDGIVKHRQVMNETFDQLYNRQEDLPYQRVTTGGNGEGSILYFESDIDLMFVVKNIICVEKPVDLNRYPNTTVFEVERQLATPGYAKLKLRQFESETYKDFIQASLIETSTADKYISSKIFLEKVAEKEHAAQMIEGFEIDENSGPSAPASNKFLSYDNVQCFRCICPDIIEKWVTRPRPKGWPSEDDINEIARLDGHAVPIGFKGSSEMTNEWRICYSFAELRLMKMLNSIQMKVYIVLKKLCKAVLKILCKDMTSYIMKNVVLWVCEMKGPELFTREDLVDRLLDCIRFLKKCVEDENIPSYMISERNLLAGRLDTQTKQQVLRVLNDLLGEEARILMRCEKFRKGITMMHKTPTLLCENGRKQDKIERLMLLRLEMREQTLRNEMTMKAMHEILSTNEQYNDIENQISLLIEVDEEDMKQKGKTREEIYDTWTEKVKELLS